MINSALSLLSLPCLSRAYGRLVRIRRPRRLVRAVIRYFARHYQIRMEDYPGNIDDYPSLMDFFVRPLDPQTRPLGSDRSHMVSPADGRLMDLQRIDRDSAAQVKGWTYQVSELIGRQERWDRGWWLATIYLSPADYHRYHYPMDSTLTGFCHLGTRLFPVNPAGVNTVPGLFVRNERVAAEFRAQGYRFHVVAVGATFVGSIKMAAHPARFRPGQYTAMNSSVRQAREMGRFEMGSTLVLLVPRDMADPVARPLSKVRVGDPLFRLKQRRNQ